MAIYESITELIGKTPLVRLKKTEDALGIKAELYAKLEYLNPTGSVKDRAALGMLDRAQSCGLIGEGTHERFIIAEERFMQKCQAKLG